MNFSFENNIEFARKLDQQDPLKSYRQQFVLGEKDEIYLDGNSLGRLPEKTQEKLRHVIDYEWGSRLIRSWNDGWYTLAKDTSRSLSKIIGCKPEEVIIADSTSINLYKLAHAALKFNSQRKKIVSDVFNFPTDLYVLQGLIDQLDDGHFLELIPSKDDIHMDPEDIDQVIDEETSLVVLSLVSFKSAYLYDMEAVTKLAHEKGALVIWDLSHAAGAVPVNLNDCHADMAVGCTYKYLNGGPGSPAYLYIRKDLQEQISSPIWGWFGDADPFSFNTNYKPAQGIEKFLVGTPPVLSLSAIKPALNAVLCAGTDAIRDKSILLSEYLVFLIKDQLLPLGFSIGSPDDPAKRGSHISLRHPEAYRICQALINPKGMGDRVIPDFREPDNIRLGLAPLYNTYGGIFRAVSRLSEIVTQKHYLKYSKEKSGVT